MATKPLDLSTMSAAQRLAFYREANKQAKPAAQADTSLAETAAKIAAGVPKFGENFMAAYRYHRNQY